MYYCIKFSSWEHADKRLSQTLHTITSGQPITHKSDPVM